MDLAAIYFRIKSRLITRNMSPNSIYLQVLISITTKLSSRFVASFKFMAELQFAEWIVRTMCRRVCESMADLWLTLGEESAKIFCHCSLCLRGLNKKFEPSMQNNIRPWNRRAGFFSEASSETSYKHKWSERFELFYNFTNFISRKWQKIDLSLFMQRRH